MKQSSNAEVELLLHEKGELPTATFTFAKKNKPQCIAHRGYKAAWPENTMGAFKGAVEVGAHAIETDIHLSKDGVVVISHDANLKRCFGKEEKIIDCEWSYLKTLQTLKAPHQAMPRLKDLLEYLATPGLEDIWILLDIKLDNNKDDVMRLIADTLAEVKPTRPWNQRVLLGCWAAVYLPLCAKYLPEYPITHIGFSISYARQFLKVPGVSFNMFQKTMVGPFGNAFLKDVREAKRSIFFWTVNDEEWMRWSIHKGVDGIITDDPKKYLEARDRYQGEVHLPLRLIGSVIWMNVLAAVFSLLFRSRYGFKVDTRKIRMSMEGTKTWPPR
ncbi:PLC-like phosphodiesterase [Bisporella sp. PMI_857]|nr:PLC-like phosphodiesterase [Bisporella sp. PMI_857]